MRRFLVSGSLAGLVFAQAMSAFAQTAQAPRKPAGPAVTRYLEFGQGGIGDDNSALVNGVLKLSLSGQQITSADLDLCFPVAPTSARTDRVTMPLQVQPGDVLTGTTTGAESGATSIRLKKTVDAEGIQIEGELRRGSLAVILKGSDLVLLDNDPRAETSDVDTADPALLSVPNELDVTVGLDAVPELVKLIRAERLMIQPVGLMPNCYAQRSGKMNLTLIGPPDRMAPAKLRIGALKGVSRVETRTLYDTDNTIRYQSAGGSAELGSLLAKMAERLVPGASSASSRIDGTRGEIVTTIQRSPAHLAPLGLEEQLTLVALPWRDEKNPTRTLVNLKSLDAKLVDAGPNPIVTGQSQIVEADGDTLSNSDIAMTSMLRALTDALSGELKAERWVDGRWTSRKPK